MGVIEQVETFLEEAERNILGFGDRFARGRIDIMLSTLKLLGIRERLPKEDANRVLAELENIEDIKDEGDMIRHERYPP